MNLKPVDWFSFLVFKRVSVSVGVSCGTRSLKPFWSLRLSSGGVKDPRVHSSEDLLLQEADDQLPDPSEHAAEVQVKMKMKMMFPSAALQVLLSGQHDDFYSKFAYSYIFMASV